MAIRICDRFCEKLLDLLCGDAIRIVPVLGPIVEQQGPVVPTPQYAGPRPHQRNLLMAFAMSDSQQVTLTPKFLDKKGKPASVDGAPTWSTDNTDVLVLQPAPDGMSCTVLAVGPLGDGTVTLKADADMGSGVTEIVGTFAVTINAGAATTVTIEAGPVSEQP